MTRPLCQALYGRALIVGLCFGGLLVSIAAERPSMPPACTTAPTATDAPGECYEPQSGGRSTMILIRP